MWGTQITVMSIWNRALTSPQTDRALVRGARVWFWRLMWVWALAAIKISQTLGEAGVWSQAIWIGLVPFSGVACALAVRRLWRGDHSDRAVWAVPNVVACGMAGLGMAFFIVVVIAFSRWGSIG